MLVSSKGCRNTACGHQITAGRGVRFMQHFSQSQSSLHFLPISFKKNILLSTNLDRSLSPLTILGPCMMSCSPEYWWPFKVSSRLVFLCSGAKVLGPRGEEGAHLKFRLKLKIRLHCNLAQDAYLSVQVYLHETASCHLACLPLAAGMSFTLLITEGKMHIRVPWE